MPDEREGSESRVSEAGDDAVDERPERLRDAVLRAFLGLGKLVALFIPELVLAAIGSVIGLVIGIGVGATLTAELFSGPGPWARAGPIALVIPLLTAVGPPLVGFVVGLIAPPVLALVPHAALMVFVARTDWRDRYAVLFATTAMAWLPALSHVGDGLSGMLSGVIVLSPFTASIGFGGGALFVAARGILDGRTIAAWWRDADGSMVLATVVLSSYAWLITWFACLLFCLLPTVPIAIGLACACSARLFEVGRHRGLALTCAVINLLHLTVLAIGIYGYLTSSSGT